MFGVEKPSPRELVHTAAALVLCAFVLYLDTRTSGEITEAYLAPLAFIVVYPVKRDWATLVVAVAALLVVVAGALLTDRGQSLRALFANRGMTVIVILGVAFLLHRVIASERALLRIATTDPLTGAYNRRHYMALLSREHQRAERYGSTFSILMLDIDHFKKINDTYGHPIGDEAIKAMASAASKHLRPSDTLGRFGGEEFVIMLPQTDAAGAVVAAERIRESVAQVAVPAGTRVVRFTVSIGVATFVPKVTVAELLESADQALYAAKTGGRNQVRTGRLGTPDGVATAPAPA
jgi:diguanylate cyclase (GGDEF)-like protein